MVKKTTESVDPSIFERERVECCTCTTEPPAEATHEVSIVVSKGRDYPRKQDIYRVTYAVCGNCARQVVEVKLDAQLLKRARRN